MPETSHGIHPDEIFRFTGNPLDTYKAGFTLTDVIFDRGKSIFDGSSSKVDSGHDWIGTKDVTLICRAKLNGYGEVSSGNLISNDKFAITVLDTNNKIRVTSDGFLSSKYSAENAVSLTEEFEVIVTRSSTGITNIYVNGEPSGAINESSGTPVNGTSNVILGNRVDQARTLDGEIDYLIAFDGIWSKADVKAWSEHRLFGDLPRAIVKSNNVVPNGNFEEDAHWVKGTGWSIANGKAHQNGDGDGTASSWLESETTVFEAGKVYQIQFDIVDYEAGGIYANDKNVNIAYYLNANGTYTFYHRSPETAVRYLAFAPSASFIGSVTNVDIREVTDGVIGEWNLERRWEVDSEILDLSGHNNNGALVNTSSSHFTKDAFGKAGKAIELTGVNEYIDCGNSNIFDMAGSCSFSLITLFKTTTTGADSLISKKADAVLSTDGYGLLFGTGGTELRFNVGDGSNGVYPSFSNPNDGRWHLVAAVYDKYTNLAHIFDNGVLRASSSISALRTISTTKRLIVGALNDGVTAHFNGTLMFVKVLNYPIGPAQYKAMYSLLETSGFGQEQ